MSAAGLQRAKFFRCWHPTKEEGMNRCTVFTRLDRCSRNLLLQQCISLADILYPASLPPPCRPRTTGGGPEVGPRRLLRQCPGNFLPFFLFKKSNINNNLKGEK